MKSFTITMLLAVLPSPMLLSCSLLVMDTNVIFGEGSHMSKAVTLAFTVTYLWFGGHRELGVTVAFIWGGLVSTTVTVTLALPVLPAWSVAFNVTVCLPRLNVWKRVVFVAFTSVLSTVLFSLHVKLNRVETASVAVPLSMTSVPAWDSCSTVTSGPTLTTGGMVS